MRNNGSISAIVWSKLISILRIFEVGFVSKDVTVVRSTMNLFNHDMSGDASPVNEGVVAISSMQV